MRRYKYKAKDKETGKELKGVIQAENEQTAGHLLIDQGYVPLTVVEEGTGLFGGKGRITAKDRITFTRQLATLIGAGLPLATSLRTVAEQTQSKTMKSTAYGANDSASYVGCSFYAPDMIDGVKKYTCVFITKAMFGPPGMTYQTKGENITFQTPTTTGEFLPDDSASAMIVDSYTADTMADAVAWCNAVLGG